MENILKSFAKKFIFRKGKVHTILKGALKGYKIKITENTQWAPLVGNWETESQYIFEKLIQEGDIVFDLGANIGIHTLLYAKLSGKKGVVIAFEPLPVNAEELENNLRLNNFTNTIVEKIAISKSTGETSFFIGVHNTQGSIDGIGNQSGQKVTVNTETLDNYVSNSNLLPDFIKIDVEGAEKYVFEGYSKGIKKSFSTIFVESHSLEDEQVILSTLKENDYLFYLQDENTGISDLGIKYLRKINPVKRLFDNQDGTGIIVAIHPNRIPVKA
jgi:FkbM family methyltransferase